ncbi:hypothetical protein B0H13DRAFT_1935690 [Mycena leptocephala]|nr:hypothetical protein B0H13DRAFT_1935690 [Mycena leptocephala]
MRERGAKNAAGVRSSQPNAVERDPKFLPGNSEQRTHDSDCMSASSRGECAAYSISQRSRGMLSTETRAADAASSRCTRANGQVLSTVTGNESWRQQSRTHQFDRIVQSKTRGFQSAIAQRRMRGEIAIVCAYPQERFDTKMGRLSKLRECREINVAADVSGNLGCCGPGKARDSRLNACKQGCIARTDNQVVPSWRCSAGVRTREKEEEEEGSGWNMCKTDTLAVKDSELNVNAHAELPKISDSAVRNRAHAPTNPEPGLEPQVSPQKQDPSLHEQGLVANTVWPKRQRALVGLCKESGRRFKPMRANSTFGLSRRARDRGERARLEVVDVAATSYCVRGAAVVRNTETAPTARTFHLQCPNEARGRGQAACHSELDARSAKLLRNNPILIPFNSSRRNPSKLIRQSRSLALGLDADCMFSAEFHLKFALRGQSRSRGRTTSF